MNTPFSFDNGLVVNLTYNEINVPKLKNISAKIKVGLQSALKINTSLISIR